MITTTEPIGLVTWQASGLRATNKGKIKPVVTGIPSKSFFYAYKHRTEFRVGAHGLGITMKRLSKGQWEAICWINRHNMHLFVALGFEIPEAPHVQDVPF